VQVSTARGQSRRVHARRERARQHVDASRILAADQVTDTYLLALARAHRGTLATFDRRLVVDAVPDGARHLELIT
jgi:predicted nucleic acid-binding protein